MNPCQFSCERHHSGITREGLWVQRAAAERGSPPPLRQAGAKREVRAERNRAAVLSTVLVLYGTNNQANNFSFST